MLRPRPLPARLAPLALAALLAAAAASCSREALAPTAPTSASGRDAGLSAALALQEDYSERLLAIEGVVGTAVTTDGAGRPVILVLAESPGLSGIPTRLGGVRVITEVTGAFDAFALTGTYRPVPIGVSAGSAEECLPGTLGCVLQVGNRRFALSANHVFARQNQAAPGEAIVQPARPDLDPGCGPAPADAVIARLSDFEPVVYDGRTPNAMDAAIAELGNTKVTCATPAGYYGAPSATTAAAFVRMPIQKLGRTTELTRGAVKAVNAKVKVTFPVGTALFTNQILTTGGFGAFGDSGALVVTDDGTNRPVGMLIGGGNNGAAIVTPIDVILARFGATLCTD